jgi:hypothetical protein
VEIVKPPLPEELVHGKGAFRADAKQRAILIGARPQVGDGAQKFIRMAFLL